MEAFEQGSEINENIEAILKVNYYYTLDMQITTINLACIIIIGNEKKSFTT